MEQQLLFDKKGLLVDMRVQERFADKTEQERIVQELLDGKPGQELADMLAVVELELVVDKLAGQQVEMQLLPRIDTRDLLDHLVDMKQQEPVVLADMTELQELVQLVDMWEPQELVQVIDMTGLVQLVGMKELQELVQLADMTELLEMKDLQELVQVTDMKEPQELVQVTGMMEPQELVQVTGMMELVQLVGMKELHETDMKELQEGVQLADTTVQAG